MSDLYAIVEQYHALGAHRTGTRVDSLTGDWFAAELERRSADVSRIAYDFPYFDARGEVRLDATVVESMPLYYCATGTYRSARVARAALPAPLEAATLNGALEALRTRAKHSNAKAAVAATLCPNGSLCAINRRPRANGQLPILLIAGAHADRLDSVRLQVVFEARIEQRQSSNVVARLGAARQAPVIVTTPLTGWFGCAGERGTGIAVLLDIIEPLAELAPVHVVGATGHELDYFGGRDYAARFGQTPRAVLHLGSSIATRAEPNAGACAALSPDIVVTSNLSRQSHAAVAAIAARLGLKARQPRRPLDPADWLGESSCWARYGCPMLSVAGYHPLFHVPEDIPERATTPALLQQSRDAVLEMCRILISS